MNWRVVRPEAGKKPGLNLMLPAPTHCFKVSHIRGEETVFQAHLYGMGQSPQSFAEWHHLHHSPQWLDGTSVMSARAPRPMVKCRSRKQSSLSVSGGWVYEPHISKEGGGYTSPKQNKVRVSGAWISLSKATSQKQDKPKFRREGVKDTSSPQEWRVKGTERLGNQ